MHKCKALSHALTSQHGSTPLHAAADKGYIQVVEILIKSGANVNATNKV